MPRYPMAFAEIRSRMFTMQALRDRAMDVHMELDEVLREDGPGNPGVQMLTNQFIQLADAFQDHLDQLESSGITIQSLDPAHCSFASPVDGCDVVVSWSENEGLELDVMPEFNSGSERHPLMRE